MDARVADRTESSASIVEDMLEACLANWSGLRLYLRQRNAGRPADVTMDRILTEVLRTTFREDADVQRIVQYLIEKPI